MDENQTRNKEVKQERTRIIVEKDITMGKRRIYRRENIVEKPISRRGRVRMAKVKGEDVE
jgi:hypothetical protein